MARAKTPVSVGGIEFDALISSEYTMESTLPEYAVETGFSITDAIILKPETLSMVLFVTDMPVTWYGRHSGGNRANTVAKQLESLYFSRSTVTVSTTDRTYTNMAIESLKISRSTENGYALEVPITFRKIRTTSAKTTTIPSSYGKSGSTGSSAGTAGTTTSSSTTSAGTSSSSSSDSTTSGSGSVLYSIGKSTGIIN